MKNNQTKSWYRPDIDGLRALAIIVVLLFHAKTAGFSGGFVGVDVFFVISGFLITSIIFKEMKQGTFSLLNFWERRARRIIPALSIVLTFTLIVGYFIILFPLDFMDLGQSTFAQSLFLANIYFMRNSGYFAGPSETAPLLHMWTLSVEEQFYILFPLIMLLIFHFVRKRLVAILIVLSALSLAYAHYLLVITPGNSFSLPGVPDIWANATNAKAAFFLLPARAVELLIGAILAITSLSVQKRFFAEILAWSGLAMIIYAIFWFRPETSFPGFNALIPTLGTAAIIFANTREQTSLGTFLSFPLFIGIGLISYSLYLWHWPLLVFAKIYLNTEILTSAQTLSMLTLAFLFAYLSYRFVETPFREKRFLTSRRSMLLGGFGALITLTTIGYYFSISNGLPERVSDRARAIAEQSVDYWDRRDECFVDAFTITNEPCYIGAQSNNNVDFVVWGDSHGAALLPVIDTVAEVHNLRGATFLSPGCIPLPDMSTHPIIQRCEDTKELAEIFIRENKIKNIILISRWSSFTSLIPSTDAEKESIAGMSEHDASILLFSNALAHSAEYFDALDTKLHIIEQVPEYKHFESRKLFYATVKNPELVDMHGVSYKQHKNYHSSENKVIEKSAQSHENVTVYDPSTFLCPEMGECLLMKDGLQLYENTDHINMSGSYLLTPLFEELFTTFK